MLIPDTNEGKGWVRPDYTYGELGNPPLGARASTAVEETGILDGLRGVMVEIDQTFKEHLDASNLAFSSMTFNKSKLRSYSCLDSSNRLLLVAWYLYIGPGRFVDFTCGAHNAEWRKRPAKHNQRTLLGWKLMYIDYKAKQNIAVGQKITTTYGTGRALVGCVCDKQAPFCAHPCARCACDHCYVSRWRSEHPQGRWSRQMEADLLVNRVAEGQTAHRNRQKEVEKRVALLALSKQRRKAGVAETVFEVLIP